MNNYLIKLYWWFKTHIMCQQVPTIPKAGDASWDLEELPPVIVFVYQRPEPQEKEEEK